ncbi:MAG: DUF5106 domain-containing protein [Tannerella sp.]|jgi:hypothetical protein|nr:DUF5106 domain-containing protein [Tannerella sp.]
MRVTVNIFLAAFIIIGCTTKTETKKEPEKPKLPAFERVTPPTMVTDPSQRAAYIIMHFWDKFPFADTMYCHAPDITERAFADFLTVFPYTTREKWSEGINKLMTSALASPVMYNFFFKTAEHYLYDPNSPMRNDEYFIPFLEHIVNLSSIKPESKIRPSELLKLAYKNRPGMKANNFTCTTITGSKTSLYGINTKYTILMFYNPGCHECQETMKMMKMTSQITDAVSAGKLRVLCVYTDHDMDLWKKYAKEVPSEWLNAHCLDVREQQVYDLKAIPTLYFLGADKTVILKDASVGNIRDFLEQNK